MAYSRWGESEWYTFWSGGDDGNENRLNVRFNIDCEFDFTAEELRKDRNECLSKVMLVYPSRDFVELNKYIDLFLHDVDDEYPPKENCKC